MTNNSEIRPGSPIPGSHPEFREINERNGAPVANDETNRGSRTDPSKPSGTDHSKPSRVVYDKRFRYKRNWRGGKRTTRRGQTDS